MNGKWTIITILISCLVLDVFAGSASAAGEPRTALFGVNDELTDTRLVPREGIYYVPVREAAEAMNLTLAGTSEQLILTNESGAALDLRPAENKAAMPDGTEVKAAMFVDKGRTMIPVGITAQAFGYRTFYRGNALLLRIVNASGVMDEAAFLDKYRERIENHLKETAKPDDNRKEAGGSKSGKPLYLTFDDGPSAHTGQLLDVLDKYGAQATFFMLGNHISDYSDSVKRMIQRGDAVGLHGMSHQKDKFYKSPAAAAGEMDDDNERLYQVAGVKSLLIRPPYGSKPYFVQSFRDKVLGEGYHLWDWNVDSQDWKFREDTQSTYDNVMKQVKAVSQKGKAPIILMHDLPTTIQVLPAILDALKKQGYDFEMITPDMKPVNFWHDTR
ncbi:polysaccharide deacetylase [Paenibacillus caui]|uniref:polysaccharide deacetylase n=1 Tax=Paenibacillus caui TaxID=2873927 RepID=UPI001CA7E41C|nr:polysaccharide deacetylase [Paenibacillus caui]